MRAILIVVAQPADNVFVNENFLGNPEEFKSAKALDRRAEELKKENGPGAKVYALDVETGDSYIYE